ncbi:MAG: ATP-binding cassette domain-containing protein [Eubacterium sp.]|nr:ATP-binding cassette domain-containing protein [Candidatus Colimonas fimequi]
MEAFRIENLTFTYPHRNVPAIRCLDLAINEGEMVVVCGLSGSGKSTLLRSLKPVLAPFGQKEGRIIFGGRPIEELDQRDQAQLIGYVMQNPDNQIVTDKVWHELAFGLESLGMDTETIRLRVSEMASFFGIQKWFHMDVNNLSGGQKQILNLAAVMVMQPKVLILDEPTAQLDPIAASDFLETVHKINRELGTTVIISEHRLEEVLPMVDRAIVLHEGEMIADASPRELGLTLARDNHPMFMAMPTPLQSYSILAKDGVGSDLTCPLDVREGRQWLSSILADTDVTYTKLADTQFENSNDDVIRMSDVWFRYDKNGEDIIRDLNLTVKAGEFLAIVGGNGTGKTTALSLIAGIRKPVRGKVKVSGKAAALPQNPQSIFVAKTLREDLAEMGRGADEVNEICKLLELTELVDSHPYDLSGGEQQRAALAKVLLAEPDIILLDEPTKGIDNSFKEKLAEILKTLQANGKTIVMVSHDVEFCGRYADRCAMFFDGKIITSGTPRRFFSGNSFYTTAGNRMSRHVFENAVTAEDVVELVRANLDGCAPGEPGRGLGSGEGKLHSEPAKTAQAPVSETHSHSGKLLAIELVTLLVAAATIYIGFGALDNKHYFAVCVLLVFYSMVPFFASFEISKPQAREIVIIAVLIATAVVGRAAFFMIPNFKPIVAIIIIAGVALGRRQGFMVGAMAAFVSNFIFGQGPWTPWQMIAMAIIGYLAGVLFHRYASAIGDAPGSKTSKGCKYALVAFGAVATFFLYGAIVDLWTILVMSPEPTLATAVAVYSAAFYFNLVHAAATVIFLMILAKPMVGKLERVKYKYGV